MAKQRSAAKSKDVRLSSGMVEGKKVSHKSEGQRKGKYPGVAKKKSCRKSMPSADAEASRSKKTSSPKKTLPEKVKSASKTTKRQNPFEVLTPENMGAKEVNSLFVEAYTDFQKIRDSGHMMVSGPRGCGKSMIFRYLLPDCQCLAQGVNIEDLDFWAFLISIKNTAPHFTELKRLEKHANLVINEHVLTLYVAIKLFDFLSKQKLPTDRSYFIKAKDYYNNVFSRRISLLGGKSPSLTSKTTKINEVFARISKELDNHFSFVTQYAKRLAFSKDGFPVFDDFFCGYNDFLFPLLTELGTLFQTNGRPKKIYLLFDDADYLNEAQTVVLNSWISTRTQGSVCIKVSTQMQYKTYATMTGMPIQSPHDYQIVNMADIFTTPNNRYQPRIKAIVQRRLEIASLPGVSPEVFFPDDTKQKAEIAKIEKEIREGETKGFRPSDDSYRYARPIYMKRLSGPSATGTGSSKSGSKYSYSGFEQLVSISSGVTRYFLDAAAKMYDVQLSESGQEKLKCITSKIQNQVIRDEADTLIDTLSDNVLKEEMSLYPFNEDAAIEKTTKNDQVKQQAEKLYNLICALGGTFRVKLLSEDSERRIFSFAISGKMNEEVQGVLDLGVRHGFFHQSYIGNKEGTGRTKLYIMTRRLAPYFNLDPTSFAGYQWIRIDALYEALENPSKILNRIRKTNPDDVWNKEQSLLPGMEDDT